MENDMDAFADFRCMAAKLGLAEVSKDEMKLTEERKR